TFFPSQLRSTDSRTIRMLTGSREISPIPCSSSAGNEKNSPSRPLPASNFLSVLNSSFMQWWSCRNDKGSFQLRQFCFNFFEIWQLPRVVIGLRVLNHAISIDDERRALGHAAHAEIHLWQE